jgi:GntR family transcriptional repressor for pyruvate dehydrogenase complex
MLRPMRPAKLPAFIAEELRRQIERGQLGPGDRIPGHRELAAIFQVSVGSVREAISALVSEGLVETRAGRGTYVARDGSFRVNVTGHNSASQLLDRGQIEELIEAREVLEPQLVALATRRATDQHLQELRTIIERMQESISDPRAFAEADVELHVAIARAAGNRYLMRTTVDTRTILKRDMELSAEVGIRRLGTLQFSVDTHRRLVAAIESGDAEKAQQVHCNILRRNHEFVLSLYSSEGISMDASGEL